MEKLFFELMQVAVGQLDCLSRGPSPEEWAELYQTAQRQAVTGICYNGVEKLFEFGLRAPQDVSIDWMAEAEEIRMSNTIVNKRCATIQKKLIERKIYTSILLGQGVATYYGAELQELRQPKGIDVYVDCGREKAVRFVKQTGQEHVRHTRQLVFLDAWEDTPVRIHPQMAHTRNRLKNAVIERWFRQNREQLFLEKEDLVMPSAQANLVYALQHLYGQMLSKGIEMRQLMDCFFILKTLNGEFGQFKGGMTIEKTMKSFLMKRFSYGVMWVMQEVFNVDRKLLPMEPLEEEGRFILQQVMEGRHVWPLLKRYPLQMMWNFI